MNSPQEEIVNTIAEDSPVPPPVEAANHSPGNGAAGTQPAIKFGRMFPDLPRFTPKEDIGLIKLAGVMIAEPNPDDHPELLAGYTYLGQLITHDITFAHERNITPDPVDDVKQVQQDRTRALDLETLYGIESHPENREENSELYDSRISNLIHLKLGRTVPTTEGIQDDPEMASRSYRNDLPRSIKDGQKTKAILGDPRNDANLALAQITVAFLRFHNKVVNQLIAENQPIDDTLFEKARRKVVQHYQWIILHDYLPKIVEKEVLQSVLDPVLDDARNNRPRNLDGRWPYIPVEFSAAAFRLGHSMLRSSYEWNRFFQSPGLVLTEGVPDLFKLFSLTHRSGNMGYGAPDPRLPSKWIVDWTRFFDFKDFNGIANNPKSNRSKKIDTNLSTGLTAFPATIRDVITEPDHQSLSAIDLLRGSRLGLPTGQAVADEINRIVADELKKPPLSEDEITNDPDGNVGPHGDVLKDTGFDKETPLWYYILREAEVRHGGERLGLVGSYIVAKTIVELMWVSRYSILQDPNWKPDLGQKNKNEFGMADLLIFADVVNPLGS